MATNTTRFALSKPDPTDTISAFQGTIDTTLGTIDTNMIGLQGAYAGGTTYYQGDVVTLSGNYYVSTTTQSATSPPGATWVQIPGSTGHYAEYSLSFAATSSTTYNPITSGWTKVSDTDNFFVGAQDGKFTVPAGLGGAYVVQFTINFPAPASGNYSLLQVQLNGLPSTINIGQRIQTTFTATAIQVFQAFWTGPLAAAAAVNTILLQINSAAAAETVTGDFSIIRTGNS